MNGRLVAVELPGVVHPATGQVVRPRYEYRYDTKGNQTLLRDPLLRETRFTLVETATGQERTRTLPLGFGADGIRGTSDDPPAGAWTERTVYDNRGRPTRQVSFEGVVTQFVYDPLTGRLSQQRFFDNWTSYADGQGTPQEVWSFTSDAFGRAVRVERAVAGGSPHVTTYQYDGEGRVTRISSPEGVVSYTYDDLGRRTAVIVGTVENPLRKTSFTYDGLGRLRTVVEDRDATVTTEPLLTTTYAYDLVGNLRRTDLPNGVVVVYRYDRLNRLDVLTYYAPDATPDDLSNNVKVAEFDYTVRADGRRSALVETFWTSSGALSNVFAWGYDDAGRLVSEVLDSSDNARDYTTSYTYDLVGNRVRSTKGSETVTSTYDVNDRLLQEVSSTGATTTYGYNATQQTLKGVTAASGSRVITTFTYDLQGRLEVGTVETRDSSGNLLRREQTTYDYDHSGIRVSALHEVDSNGDGSWDQRIKTEYLNDPHNHTGYSQVLRETYFDATTGLLQKRIDYTIGLDEIAQTTTTYDAAGNVVNRETLVFGHDGHGSVRVLFDLTATLLQLYVYQAYGELAAIYNAAGQFVSANPSDALTSLLHDGEPFDVRLGWGYRRARWVDASNGRFNQFDPFFGNLWEPQSFHKYLFTHGDPINFTDPSGRFPSGFAGFVTAVAIGGALLGGTYGAIVGWKEGGFGRGIVYGVIGAIAGGIIGATLGAALWGAMAAFARTGFLQRNLVGELFGPYRHPKSEGIFLAGLVFGLIMGAFAPEHGMNLLLYAAVGLLGDPLIYDYNIWLRHPENLGRFPWNSQWLFRDARWNLYTVNRTTVFFAYYFSVGYVLGFFVGVTARWVIDRALDQVRAIWPPPPANPGGKPPQN